MSAEEASLVHAILGTLLDRFEQPSRQTVVRVRLNRRDHPQYFSATDGRIRLETNRVLDQLAHDGALVLHWVRWERGNWLEAADLVPEQAATVYRWLGRTPRGTQIEAVAELLAFESSHAPWHAAFLAWARQQLAQGRAIAPLKLDDGRWNRGLLRGLAALAQLREPALERTLSVRLFGDSKRFEQLRPAIVGVLRRHDPSAASYGDDQWALLRAHLLERVPEYVPIAGPLMLWTAHESDAGPVLDLAPLGPGLALPAPLIRSVAAVRCGAWALVTVENATSFSELVAVRPADVLAVYSGGFASPTVVTLLKQIKTSRADLELFHWGDLDAGGLRILAHLRSQLGTVTPLAMDPHVLDEYQERAQPLTAGDTRALEQLRAHPALADCGSLIDAMLHHERKLEQEAVAAVRVAQLLQHMRTKRRG